MCRAAIHFIYEAMRNQDEKKNIVRIFHSLFSYELVAWEIALLNKSPLRRAVYLKTSSQKERLLLNGKRLSRARLARSSSIFIMIAPLWLHRARRKVFYLDCVGCMRVCRPRARDVIKAHCECTPRRCWEYERFSQQNKVARLSLYLLLSESPSGSHSTKTRTDCGSGARTRGQTQHVFWLENFVDW